MKVEQIELSWFRGASTNAILKAKGKSVAVFGENACGKSSFVDAVEYILTKGKIKHLQHEYSGTQLYNSIRNTETPEGQESAARICFENQCYVGVVVPPLGRIRFGSSSPEVLQNIQDWDVRRHILRQDEVADFIRSTKSEKYSTLSPLLGLQTYEDLAQNIAKIRDSVLKKSKIESFKDEKANLQLELVEFFTSMEPNDVKTKIIDNAGKYVTILQNEAIDSISNKALKAIDIILQDKEPAVKRYSVLENIYRQKVDQEFESLEKTEEMLVTAASQYIDYKIPILENVDKILLSTIEENENIECPACGREISKAEFKAHVDAELSSLKKARDAKKQSKTIKQLFISKISTIKALHLSEPAFIAWLSLPENKTLNSAIVNLENLPLEEPDSRWSQELLKSLKQNITILTPLIQKEVTVKPPTTQAIFNDFRFFKAALKFPRYIALKEDIGKVDLLLSTLDDFYASTRQEITKVTTTILQEISSEIARIWKIIHPDDPIENIHLTPSTDADKAIEVCLKFYGKDQPSPRLTLSEGYRNSLGLSIFLALANQKGMKDKPILLDDIVSSLDREHRGMITDLLCRELTDRQVLLFTHDREWFDELKNRLNSVMWDFYTLKKWVNPKIGIEVLPSSFTFTDAEKFLPDHPESTGNAVRAIMDTELPKAAERLKLEMPYKYGNHNDHRMAVEFLNEFISQGETKFRLKTTDNWTVNQASLDVWKETVKLLIAWADRASHGRSLTAPEARELIDYCKRTLACFKCPSCGKGIWELQAKDFVQCQCGAVRWKT